MRLDDLIKISKIINSTIDSSSFVDVLIKLDKHKQEVLQQEVYKFKNNTIRDYSSKKTFDIIIGNVKFVIKIT